MKSADQHEIPFISPMECLPVDPMSPIHYVALKHTSATIGAATFFQLHIILFATEELKLDGYRGQAIRDTRGVHLLSRRGRISPESTQQCLLRLRTPFRLVLLLTASLWPLIKLVN
jgi:hypothetical protein